jgi:cellulose synthase/poly-beta-1,6-N-acetylglucosamine synthase-like glycosyltransferase
MNVNEKLPSVTAVVTCYNQAKYVQETLESVASQTYPNLQVIVIDDCSKDDSPVVIEKWIQSRGLPWQFIRHAVNQGLCKTLNEALKHASGSYIAFVAADDIWLPDKTLQQVKVLQGLPTDVGVAYSDMLRIDEQGRVYKETYFQQKVFMQYTAMPEGRINEQLWRQNFISAPSAMVRKTCYEKVGAYDDNLFYEDWDMWLRISRHYKFTYSSTITVKYRILPTSMARESWDKIARSAEDIVIKNWRQRTLPVAMHGQAAELLRSRALEAYEQRPRSSCKYICELLKARFSFKHVLLLMCAWSSIPYAVLRSVSSSLRIRNKSFI